MILIFQKSIINIINYFVFKNNFIMFNIRDKKSFLVTRENDTYIYFRFFPCIDTVKNITLINHNVIAKKKKCSSN